MRFSNLIFLSLFFCMSLLTNSQVGATFTATEVTELRPSDGLAGDDFGLSAAMSGNTVVIGAWQHDGTFSNTGAAYVYVLSGGVWTQQYKLVASDASAEARFGLSVAIRGNTAVIGARGQNGPVTSSGAAYVFTLTGPAGILNEDAKLVASDAATSDQFGNSVAISGDIVLVGSSFHNHVAAGAGNSGATYVFDITGGVSGTVTEDAELLASDAQPGDNFGADVALSGDTAVIGAFRDDNAAPILNDSGSAYYFDLTGGVSGIVNETAKLVPSVPGANDLFSNTVAVSGKNAVIGSGLDDDNGSNSGSAYFFDLSGVVSGTVTEDAQLLPSDGAANDVFGFVGVSGNTAVIGAHQQGNTTTPNGAAWVFDLIGASGLVNEDDKLLAGDGVAGDQFGVAAAVSGSTVVIGAFLHDHTGSNKSGAAYIFSLDNDATSVSDVPTPTGDDITVIDLDVFKQVASEVIVAGTSSGHFCVGRDDRWVKKKKGWKFISRRLSLFELIGLDGSCFGPIEPGSTETWQDVLSVVDLKVSGWQKSYFGAFTIPGDTVPTNDYWLVAGVVRTSAEFDGVVATESFPDTLIDFSVAPISERPTCTQDVEWRNLDLAGAVPAFGEFANVEGDRMIVETAQCNGSRGLTRRTTHIYPVHLDTSKKKGGESVNMAWIFEGIQETLAEASACVDPGLIGDMQGELNGARTDFNHDDWSDAISHFEQLARFAKESVTGFDACLASTTFGNANYRGNFMSRALTGAFIVHDRFLHRAAYVKYFIPTDLEVPLLDPTP